MPLYLLFVLSQLLALLAAVDGGGGGRWTLLQKSIGITAMHMQLLNNDRVVIYDRTDFGASNLPLPRGKCRDDPSDVALEHDCTAHSAEYDVAANTFRPLMVQTDVWCSSGAVAPDGRLVQAGGYLGGERRVRIFQPCQDDACDWEEIDGGLAEGRWYATSQALPDGRQIIVGGRNKFTYEFYPKTASSHKAYSLRFLADTFERGVENNLYPFVFLNVDGNLFIFANNRAILFNYRNGVVLRTYPALPGGEPRSYPSTGSAVLLPLKDLTGRGTIRVEVLVCGGAPRGSFSRALNGKFVTALDTCGRISINDASPEWVMENMPLPRVMGDMVLLPNGDVLIVNGGSKGTAGWESGRDPILEPVIYRPDEPVGSRFEIQSSTTIPRMYHSTAILLRDGRVLIGGSNPHIFYNFTDVLYPTELSLEAFSPPYLDPESSRIRPAILLPTSHARLGYGQKFTVRFSIPNPLSGNKVWVTMVAPSFNTHSFSMNQRLLVIGEGTPTDVGKSAYEIRVRAPGSGNLAPPGFYLVYVVHAGVPSEGIWVQIR